MKKESLKPEETQDESLVQRMAGPSSTKAGLGSIDKEAINKKIYELSKGSKFFENERRKNERLTQKINDILEKYSKLKMDELNHLLPVLNKIEKEIENSRDLSQTIVHVDMDAYYASVEELDNPSLKDIPIGVGDMQMLSTANYEARKYGVRSAMPGFIAKELCPNLTIVPGRFDRYIELSNQVREIFAEYDSNFRAVGLDEAYLNITGYLDKNKVSAEEAVKELRSKIFSKTKLTASAGIGCNKLLAKISSDFNKPNGQYMVPFNKEKILDFILPLPIRKISGIGRVTERVLNAVGIKTCRDAYNNQLVLYSLFSEKTFYFVFESCLGISSNDINLYEPRKSISHERTFNELSNLEDLTNKLKELAIALSRDVEKKQLKGKTVTLKIKTPGFEVRVKSKTCPNYISSFEEIFEAGKKLLEKEYPVSMRLMGLRLSNLIDKGKMDNSLSILDFFSKKCEKGLEKDNKGREDADISSDTEYESISEDDVEIIDIPKKREVATMESIDRLLVIKEDVLRYDLPEVNQIPQMFECPVCMKKYVNRFTNNVQINQHIDSCLENSEIPTDLSIAKKSRGAQKKLKINSKKGGSKDSIKAFFKSLTKKQ